ncbi:MAG: PIG-L deacetylase family protein [Oceanicaulis sp.]
MSAPVSFEGFLDRLGAPARISVLAPHPDDETCGCGGFLALCARAGLAVSVILATDGGASHEHSPSHGEARLKQVRRAEMARALRRLGVAAPVARLDLPDGDCERLDAAGLAPARRRLARRLSAFRPDLVLAPWRRDPHGDHRAAHHLARGALPRGARLVEYDVWTALTGAPADQPRKGEVERVALDIRPVLSAKRRALQAHASQLGRRITDDPGGFAFTRGEQRRLLAPVEHYFL